MKRFEGKVVLITGSSNGIGRATAVLFASEGARVVLTGRSETALEESRVACVSAGAAGVLAIRGDLVDEEYRKSLVQQTVNSFGGIHVLVNNAGNFGPDGTTTVGFEQPLDHLDYCIDLNVKSALSLSLLAMPHLEKAQGEIIFVSSITALNFAVPGMVLYAASKAALDQVMRALAADAVLKGVRVNAVNPGMISTAILEKHGSTREYINEAEAAWAGNPSAIPLGRMGRPDEIAAIIAFLTDRKTCGFIVGQTIVADGGSTIINPLLRMLPKTQ